MDDPHLLHRATVYLDKYVDSSAMDRIMFKMKARKTVILNLWLCFLNRIALVHTLAATVS